MSEIIQLAQGPTCVGGICDIGDRPDSAAPGGNAEDVDEIGSAATSRAGSDAEPPSTASMN